MQTEVGVIPAEWEVQPCSEVSDRIMVGIVIRPTQYYVPHGVPAFRSANIREDGITDSDLVYISASSNALLAKSQTRTGDVLTVRTGYPGTSAVVRPAHAGCNCIDILITRPSRRILSDFLAIWINSSFGKEQVLRNQGGLAQKHFNVGDMRNLVVALPALPEQRAIATALNDVDALLGGLDRLIAKKRDLRQAAMQQLLTGQTRLPGFHGEWEVKRLGDHVTFLRNGVNSRAELLPEGRVRYLHYGDVHACKDTDLSPDSLPFLPDAKAVRLDRLRDGDLIFADASEDIAGVSKSVELRGIGNTEVVPGLHTIAARFDKTVLADGFKGFLQSCPPFATHLRRLAAGTKVYATNRAHIASVEMRLPRGPEQVAIAAVLSDMESELAALEARRLKTRDLKQAMMQELLTGKTRLVSTRGAHV
jgi:type I restriction enzyme S subunit